MKKEEFEKLSGYEVRLDDYEKIIEPMYLATNLSPEDFIKCIDKNRFALRTREELINKMQNYARWIKETCTLSPDHELKEKLEKVFAEYRERFDSSANMENDMLLSCYYPSRITSSSTKDIIYLQQDGPFSEVKSIQDVESKYVYFEIKTAYSHESYFALPKYESLEHCADVFLSEICFCDAYEITLARYATMKECNDIDEFMKLEKVPKGYWDAGEEMSLLTARNCYFQEQENNLKRGKSR